MNTYPQLYLSRFRQFKLSYKDDPTPSRDPSWAPFVNGGKLRQIPHICESLRGMERIHKRAKQKYTEKGALLGDPASFRNYARFK